jgi:16S rRNA G527 N7-methylase RsmG
MSILERAAAWAEIGLTAAAKGRLDDFGRWLADEAMSAGGIGPHEVPELERRHLADSLTLAQPWRGSIPKLVVDLGSGVVDRSAQRCALARRAVRILGLDNVRVVPGDIDAPGLRANVVVTRAARPPAALLPVLPEWLEPGGLAIVAGSNRRRPDIAGYAAIEVPAEVLDRASWILIMAPPKWRTHR